MKILLTLNKTLSNGTSKWLDSGYYNVYLPLKNLGHEVYLWDTVDPDEPDYEKVIESFDPELIFCCITGDRGLTPAEHLCMNAILEETKKGIRKTFNWFCDDVWRYENFSKNMCNFFNVCSTTEPEYIEIYKQNGYKNILLTGWHVNDFFYTQKLYEKVEDMSFIGHTNNPERVRLINHLNSNGINIKTFKGVSHEEMIKNLSSCKIGVNFSKNYCGFPVKTQVKLRPFEIAAAKSLIFTQHHKGLEAFFETDKEMISFKDENEMIDKAKFLLSNESHRNTIAENGNKRFKQQYESHVRMKKIIEEIMSL
jgi:spore maturation protein CgeB